MVDPAALQAGRDAFAEQRWEDAVRLLSEGDGARPLAGDDLERLGRAAYMLSLDDDYVAAFERAHRAHLHDGRVPAAVRCTWWIGHSHLFRGQRSRAEGWFATGERLLAGWPDDCVERGYLLIPAWLRQLGAGDWIEGLATTAADAEIGERFGDLDLTWLARDDHARALVKLGRLDEAMRIVDELLVTVEAGALSPVVTGIVLCNTVDFSREATELRHAREWTDALTTWCAAGPQMVAHLGLCLVHRAELSHLGGDPAGALEQAQRAVERYSAGALNRVALGKAYYCQGEVHRLQGRRRDADACYQQASRHGCPPDPGAALLLLAEGNHAAAAAMLRRAMIERVEPLQRAALLPAYVTVMLADGDLDAARAASDQLATIAESWRTEALRAAADAARSAVSLAEGAAAPALDAARRAWQTWDALDAPLEAARARLLVAQACRMLGDEESARMEAEAAREVFDRLDAVADLAAVEEEFPRGGSALSAREMEVLRLVAAGHTNQAIAERLVLSRHTVARHVQNIYAKVGVSSRAAATAYAFDSGLM
jgi:DNA-binding CsgD family transcriptional regulator